MLMTAERRASDLELTKDILHLFGAASGLEANIQKSSDVPIQCSVDELAVLLQEHLPCEVKELPCKHLGLPLPIK